MSFATVCSRTLNGVYAPSIAVEVHLANGLPSFTIVGLAETSIKESRDRVRSAIINSNFNFPPKKITVNLAPADLPKEGAGFDLPIAMGILMASQQLPVTEKQLENYEFVGELALNGYLRAVAGILPMAKAISKTDRIMALPDSAILEAALIDHLPLVHADTINGLIEKISRDRSCLSQTLRPTKSTKVSYPAFSDIKGQQLAKRALEIAASGRHNLLMIGPPGCGKTMLASRLPGILPALTHNQAIETACVHSISKHGFDYSKWQQTPIRSPHHSCSAAALIGGGSNPTPGEVSLAHNGVLFLDELCEFDMRVLNMLREPLESGRINISRVHYSQTYPADILLIAATNPCHCGYLGSTQNQCRCSVAMIDRYRVKMSGPLLDRFDMHLELTELKAKEMMANTNGESNATISSRVVRVRKLQYARQGKLNSKLNVRELEKEQLTSDSLRTHLNQLIEKLNLSVRSYHRLLRLSRTIADMANEPAIFRTHINEALQYRQLDRFIDD